MTGAFKTPGVHLGEVAISAPTALQTGVPAFVGFGSATNGGGPGPVVLEHVEELPARFVANAASYLAPTVAGFFANGGVRCYVVGAAHSNALEDAGNLIEAINGVLPTLDVDLVAVPDAMSTLLSEDNAKEVQKALLRHCASEGNRLAILDAPKVKREPDPSVPPPDPSVALIEWRNSISHDPTNAPNPANGTLYCPWLWTAATATTTSELVPPCGHVAGIFARSDARLGVFKAPANEEILGALDLEYLVDTATQEQLNPLGINCLRAFVGRGLRVWGARTLSQDPAWYYANVRRLVLTLARWIERNMTWVPFEPNGPTLWLRIQRELRGYLEGLWRAGGLTGTKVDEAFYVKCDGENNPREQRDLGQVTTEIGLAPAPPAEFIVIRVIHRAGSSEVI